MKRCSNPKCQKLKHESAFYERPTTKDGLNSWCKKCNAEASKACNRKKPNAQAYANKIEYQLKSYQPNTDGHWDIE